MFHFFIEPVLEKHDDTQHIIDFIFRANMYEECICEGLLALHQIFNSNNSSESVFLDKLQLVLLKQRNKDLITSAMSKFILNVKIQLAGCAILSILVMNGNLCVLYLQCIYEYSCSGCSYLVSTLTILFICLKLLNMF